MKQRGGDFKSPGNSGTPDSPGNAKKKRRTSTAGSGSSSSTPPAVQSSPMPELVPPPPMIGYGDTIIASNPFDDTPLPPRSMGQMSGGMPNSHMNMNCPPGSHGAHLVHGGSPGHGSPGPGQIGLGSPGPIHLGHGGPHLGPSSQIMPGLQMVQGSQMNIGNQMGPNSQIGPGQQIGPGGPGSHMGPGQIGPGPLGQSGSPLVHSGGGSGHGHIRDSGGPMGHQQQGNHLPPGMVMGNQPWNGPPKSVPMQQMYHQMGPGGPMNNGPMNQGGPVMQGGPGNRPNGMPMGPQMGQQGGGHMPPGMQQGSHNMIPSMMGPQSQGQGGHNFPPGMIGQQSQGQGSRMPPGMMGQQQQAQWNGPPKPIPIQSGTIHPHDQPMVFNSQNPNAPPIYPCGVCHKEVHDNDQAIPCESGCNFWFHRMCTGLTEAAYHFLIQEVYAEWVCDKCINTKSVPLVKYKP